MYPSGEPVHRNPPADAVPTGDPVPRWERTFESGSGRESLPDTGDHVFEAIARLYGDTTAEEMRHALADLLVEDSFDNALRTFGNTRTRQMQRQERRQRSAFDAEDRAGRHTPEQRAAEAARRAQFHELFDYFRRRELEKFVDGLRDPDTRTDDMMDFLLPVAARELEFNLIVLQPNSARTVLQHDDPAEPFMLIYAPATDTGQLQIATNADHSLFTIDPVHLHTPAAFTPPPQHTPPPLALPRHDGGIGRLDNGVRVFDTDAEGMHFGLTVLNRWPELTPAHQHAVWGYARNAIPNHLLRHGDAGTQQILDRYHSNRNAIGLLTGLTESGELTPAALRPVYERGETALHQAIPDPDRASQAWEQLAGIFQDPAPDHVLSQLAEANAQVEPLFALFQQYLGLPVHIDSVRRQIGLIDEAIGQPLPHTEPFRVARGLQNIEFMLASDGKPLGDRDPSLLLGAVQHEPGYLSTSVTHDLVTLPDGRTFSYRINFTLPVGAHGLWVEYRGVVRNLTELLLPRGIRYRITTVSRDNATGMPVFEAEILPATSHPFRPAQHPGPETSALDSTDRIPATPPPPHQDTPPRSSQPPEQFDGSHRTAAALRPHINNIHAPGNGVWESQPGDGNCMFHAVTRVLGAENDPAAHEDLRAAAVEAAYRYGTDALDEFLPPAPPAHFMPGDPPVDFRPGDPDTERHGTYRAYRQNVYDQLRHATLTHQLENLLLDTQYADPAAEFLLPATARTLGLNLDIRHPGGVITHLHHGTPGDPVYTLFRDNTGGGHYHVAVHTTGQPVTHHDFTPRTGLPAEPLRAGATPSPAHSAAPTDLPAHGTEHLPPPPTAATGLLSSPDDLSPAEQTALNAHRDQPIVDDVLRAISQRGQGTWREKVDAWYAEVEQNHELVRQVVPRRTTPPDIEGLRNQFTRLTSEIANDPAPTDAVLRTAQVLRDLLSRNDAEARWQQLLDDFARYRSWSTFLVRNYDDVFDPDVVQRHIAQLDQATGRALELTEPLHAVGNFVIGKPGDPVELDERNLIETVRTEPGYLTVSLGDEPPPARAGDASYRMELAIPPGARGIYLDGQPNQRRLLLARDTSYRITGIDRSATGITVVHATVEPGAATPDTEPAAIHEPEPTAVQQHSPPRPSGDTIAPERAPQRPLTPTHWAPVHDDSDPLLASVARILNLRDAAAVREAIDEHLSGMERGTAQRRAQAEELRRSGEMPDDEWERDRQQAQAMQDWLADARRILAADPAVFRNAAQPETVDSPLYLAAHVFQMNVVSMHPDGQQFETTPVAHDPNVFVRRTSDGRYEIGVTPEGNLFAATSNPRLPVRLRSPGGAVPREQIPPPLDRVLASPQIPLLDGAGLSRKYIDETRPIVAKTGIDPVTDTRGLPGSAQARVPHSGPAYEPRGTRVAPALRRGGRQTVRGIGRFTVRHHVG